MTRITHQSAIKMVMDLGTSVGRIDYLLVRRNRP